MDKYLLEILKDVNTIIIPGLGALTITNHDSGEIMFMSYLKHDDGKLSAYIAEKEGIDENDAKNLIAKYVREITTQLDQGDSYDMFKFGSFIKDGEDVDFKNWSETDIPSVSPSKEEKITPTPIIKQAPKEVSIDKEKDSPVSEEKKSIVKHTETSKTEKTVVTPAVDKLDEKTNEVKPKVNSTQKHITEPLNIIQKEEITANSEKLNKLRKQKENQKEKKQRGVGFWMLIVLLVIIIGGGTTIGIFYDDVRQHIPFLADDSSSNAVEHNAIEEMAETLGIDDEASEKSIDEDENTNDLEEKIIQEEEIVEDEQLEEIAEEESVSNETIEVSNSEGGSFHLIAGSFSSLENANRLVDKLKAAGYPAKVMAGSGLHMVSVKSYSTRTDANAGRSEVNDVAPKAWVLEWK